MKFRATANTTIFRTTKAGGYIGILTALAAFYTGFAGMLAGETNPLFTLPVGPL